MPWSKLRVKSKIHSRAPLQNCKEYMVTLEDKYMLLLIESAKRIEPKATPERLFNHIKLMIEQMNVASELKSKWISRVSTELKL